MPYKKHFRFDRHKILEECKHPNRLQVMLTKLSKGESLSVDDDFLFPSDTQNENNSLKEQQHDTVVEPIEIKAEGTVTELPDIEIMPEQEQYGYYIQQDSDLSEADGYLKTAIQFCLLVKKIENKIKLCKEKMIEEERVAQDLLHEAQLPLKNDKDSILIYRLLHRSRRKRQEYKDLFIILKLLFDYISQNKDVFDGLMPIVNLAEKKVNGRSSRVYMQRSALPLPIGDTFRNLPVEEQNRIKSFYEHGSKIGY